MAIDFIKTNSSSINQLFLKVLMMNDRSLKILEGLTNAMVTSDKVVSVELTDADGNLITYKIPSLSNITNEVTNLQDSLNLMKQSKVLDYEEKSYNSVSIFVEPNTVTKIPVINLNANIYDNPIVESLFDKITKIKIDVTDSVNSYSKNIELTKILINETEISDDQLALIQKANNLYYETLLQRLKENNIPYSTRKEVIDLNPLETSFSGEFNILGYVKNSESISTINSTKKYSKKYKFNTIKYRVDSYSNSVKNSTYKELAVNDILIKNYVDRYTVKSVEKILDNGQLKEYIVELEKDFETDILALNDILHIGSTIIKNRYFEVEVHPTKKMILFIKDISPNLNIVNSNYTVGVFVDPKNIIVEYKNTKIDFKNFFYNNVNDFSEYFDGLKTDLKIPAISGIKPNTPVLVDSNFKVVQLNTQIKSTVSNDVKTLMSDLTFYNSRLQSLNELKTEYTQTLFDLINNQGKNESDTEVINIKKDISSVETDIIDIKLSIKNTQDSLKNLGLNVIDMDTVDAKYQIKGLWEFPQPIKDSKNRLQDVIAFDIEYKYLDLLKNPTSTPSIDFKKLDGSVINAIFPTSNIIRTETRPKVWNESKQKYVWDYDNITETSPNVNQAYISINPYEIVAIRVRSVSEAGWPDNPLVSEWSNQIFVSFPEEYRKIDVETTQAKTILSTVNNQTDLQVMVNELYNEISLLKDQLQQKVLQTGIYEDIELTLAIKNQERFIELKSNPLEETLMIFNRSQGTLLNPTTDYTLSKNIIKFQQSYLAGMQVCNRLLFFYKSSTIN
jgi:hypothetical protein